jgi:hypothetical protein
MRNAWNRDGFCVCPGLFSEQEVLGFRQRALHLARQFNGAEIVDKSIPVDLLSDAVFQSLVLDPRILNLARELVGPRVVYFGDSKVTIISKSRGQYHKDNGRRGPWPLGEGYDPFDSREGPYNVLRIFVYLQDHRKVSGNLRIKRGSHRLPFSRYSFWPRDLAFWMTKRLRTFPSPRGGRRVNVNTALGDVVAMNLRTTHGPNAVRIKGLPQFVVDPAIQNLVPGFLREPRPTMRIALIITLGAPGVHLDRFIYSRMRRASADKLGRRYREATFDSPEMQLRASQSGLELRFDLVQRAREWSSASP